MYVAVLDAHMYPDLLVPDTSSDAARRKHIRISSIAVGFVDILETVFVLLFQLHDIFTTDGREISCRDRGDPDA